MALSSAVNRVAFTGNGSTTAFAVPFKFIANADLTVLLVTIATNAIATKVLDTDYTVTGADEDAGGTVTMTVAPTAAQKLVIVGKPNVTQGLDLGENDPFPAENVEEALDNLATQNRRSKDLSERSIRLNDAFTGTFDPTLPMDLADSAGKAPIMNSSGDGIAAVTEWVTADDIANAQTYAAAADASADAAAASASAASTSEGLAELWATKTDGIVDSTDYASKAWAIGGTGVSTTAARGAAKEWATKTDAPVDTTEFSSKEYSQGTQAATGGSSKNWAQQTGADVTGATANSRSAKSWAQDNNTGATLGGSAKDWAQHIGSTVDGTEFSAKYYAQNAAASLASAFFRDVVSLTSASSPYTISQADNGKLLDINSSGGAITINLPTIAGLSLPFNVALKLTTAGNTVTINRGGTDTINGATTATLTAAGTGLQIAADTDGTPDNWTTLDFGSIADGSVTLAKLAAAVAAALVPAGTMLPYGGASVPTGYLFCDGRAVSRSTYSDLFTAIGTRWGSGDGSTTFNLPETRYEFLRGYGGIPNVTGTGSASSNNATFTAHGYTKSGTKVRLSSGTLSGLSTATDYFVIYVDANTLAFATTRANALAGTKIAISGANSAVIIQYEDPDATSRVASASGGATGDNIGSVQEQATARPASSFTTGTESANHTHTVTDGSGNAQTINNAPTGSATGVIPRASTSNTPSSLITGNQSANHTHTVTGGGDNETRPQNISAMFIIKT